MVVGRPGTLLGPLELSICLGSANQNTKPMSPERKSEEDCRWEPPVEEMEGDSMSSEGGRMTDSTDDEETSSTESARTPEEMPGSLHKQEEVPGTLYRQEDDVGSLSQPEEVVGALSQQKETTGSLHKQGEVLGTLYRQEDDVGTRSQPEEVVGALSQQKETTGSLHKQGEVVGSPVQRRLEVEQMKVMSRISQLEQQIRELQLQRREVNIEVEMEVALLEGELRTERKEMDREEELIQALHDHLRETERRMQEERDKDKLRLKDEKMKIKELEQKISECRAQLDKQPESLREQLRKQIQEMTEMVEGAMKSFEDLEFQQLERESSREEEREASYRHISESISKHQNELNQRKDKILRLEEQIRGAEEQAQEERQRLSDENSCVFQSLNKEKERLMALGALCGKEPSQPGQESKPRKGLQRTSSLPRRRGNAPFLRPTDRPVSLHGNTCLENAGLAVHLAVSSSSTGGKIALAISPNLQSTRARNTQERKGINGGNPVNGHAMAPLNYGPMPKIAEMERQLREAMAEKERLLKAREAKRVAKEMTHRSEPNQNKVKEETAVTTSAVTMQPHQVTMEPAGDPVKALSVPRTPSPFDLRAYLESSGHSVETCPHVKVGSMCCKGYLVKMGGRIKTWKKRWFVFDRQKRRLAYYSDKEEQKLKGVIYFQAIEEVYYDHLRSASKSPHPKLTFCLKTFERLFCMVAPTPEAMRIWMDVMVTAAEENSRY